MHDARAIDERVVVSRHIAAAREVVFRSWTDPVELMQWWGPDGFTCPEAEVDLRPGGAYRLVMRPPTGDPVVVSGTYREVVAPSLLVYTWRWGDQAAVAENESLVTVEFRPTQAGTEVVVTHDRFPTGEETGPYSTGWDQGLDKLQALLEAPPGA